MTPTINPLDKIIESGILGALLVVSILGNVGQYLDGKKRGDAHLADIKTFLVNMQTYADTIKTYADTMPSIKTTLDTVLSLLRDNRK